MMDPYAVLGVSRSASDDEIKKAYRNLSRKYHPDANINNPNKAAAEEKFKEVQAAYNQIMDEKQNGTSSFYGSYGSQSRSQSSYSGSYSYQADDPQLVAAARYINNRQYYQAMEILSTMPDERRNGKWYFFAAVASQGLGNLNDAREYISRAIALDPGNFEYRQFAQSLHFSTGWYTNQSRGYGYTRPYSGVARWCISMALLNLFCNLCCCGGGMGFGGPMRY